MKSKILQKIFKFEIPYALTLEEWREWHKKQKETQPIAYFWCYKLGVKIDNFFSRISNIWYWIKCHIYRKYHILDLRKGDILKQYDYGWVDFDNAAMYAIFILLERHIEDLNRGIIVEDEIQAEAREIYRWFKEDYPRKMKEWDSLTDDLFLEINGSRILNKDCLEKVNKMEVEIDEIVTEKLKRLIEIRKHLWV